MQKALLFPANTVCSRHKCSRKGGGDTEVCSPPVSSPPTAELGGGGHFSALAHTTQENTLLPCPGGGGPLQEREGLRYYYMEGRGGGGGGGVGNAFPELLAPLLALLLLFCFFRPARWHRWSVPCRRHPPSSTCCLVKRGGRGPHFNDLLHVLHRSFSPSA